LLVAAVAVSMLLTPLLLVAADRWLAPRLARSAPPRCTCRDLTSRSRPPVIIAGFGRYGQIVGRLLWPGPPGHGAGPRRRKRRGVRRFGWPVFYGDATRLDLLRTAGAATARVMVVAIDDVEQSPGRGGPGARALPAGWRWWPGPAT
jgi:glutathione-regulated potassium-efflux system ancillary protein KefC